MNLSPEQWSHFITICEKATAEGQLSDLLQLILTADEQNTIPQRLLVVEKLLAGGYPQRDIATKHQISIATITRGSNELKRLSPNQKEKLKRLLEIE